MLNVPTEYKQNGEGRSLEVFSGYGHSCLISDIQSIAFWGSNKFGQSDMISHEDLYILQLGVGGGHTCSISRL